jgi:hypothetical protein
VVWASQSYRVANALIGEDEMAELKHPDLVYDVGMSRGEDTEFYLKKGYRTLAIRPLRFLRIPS